METETANCDGRDGDGGRRSRAGAQVAAACGDPITGGGTFVTKKMDRDLICYFNLVDMIGPLGYSSLDYMYYSKNDGRGLQSMVLIQADEQVIEMLREYQKYQGCEPVLDEEWK
ncbi:hypothetical protein ACP70R_041010 [Stipagrostis hirtigluma subsp. patula]